MKWKLLFLNIFSNSELHECFWTVLTESTRPPVSPTTKNNWQGIGVKPDIEISKEKALITAHITALEN